MRARRVVVVGDLLLDLLARTDGPVALGTDTFTTIHTGAGGSGANAASWLAQTAPEIEMHFVGKVGDDVFGRFLTEELERAGVIGHLGCDKTLSTGKVFVLVDGEGERTMITSRGASESLCPEDLPKDIFDPDAHLHLTGYTLSGGSRRETAFAAMDLARRSGMSFSVDPSSVPMLRDIGLENFLKWTGGASLLFPNLEEGRLLSGEEDPESVADALLESYNAVVLKLGPDGALYADVEGARERLPATLARVVDTTGAGDALCAGFLAAWLRAETSRDALRLGLETAARAISRIGARPASESSDKASQ